MEIDHEDGQAKIIIPEAGEGIKHVKIEHLAEHYTGYTLYIRESTVMTSAPRKP